MLPAERKRVNLFLLYHIFLKFHWSIWWSVHMTLSNVKTAHILITWRCVAEHNLIYILIHKFNRMSIILSGSPAPNDVQKIRSQLKSLNSELVSLHTTVVSSQEDLRDESKSPSHMDGSWSRDSPRSLEGHRSSTPPLYDNIAMFMLHSPLQATDKNDQGWYFWQFHGSPISYLMNVCFVTFPGHTYMLVCIYQGYVNLLLQITNSALKYSKLCF